MSKGVLVGYDGSEGSGAALDWAAAEAVARDVPLSICHVWSVAYAGPAPVGLAPLANAVTATLKDAQERAEKAAPGVRVSKWSVCGSPTASLLEAAKSAELIVVGSRGHGAVHELILGSVSSMVAAHAEQTVVIVPAKKNPPPATGQIVIGYDGSVSSERALTAALREARLHGLRLTAICIWPSRVHLGPAPFLNGELARDAAEHRFHDTVQNRAATEPDAHVKTRFLVGEPELLLSAEPDAQLLVLGTHGRSALGSRLLGSVGHLALHRAPCPIMIVR